MHALNLAVGNPIPTPSPRIKEAVKVDDSRKMEMSQIDSALCRHKDSEICINWLLLPIEITLNTPPPPAPPQNQIRIESKQRRIIKLNFCCSQQLSKTL